MEAAAFPELMVGGNGEWLELPLQGWAQAKAVKGHWEPEGDGEEIDISQGLSIVKDGTAVRISLKPSFIPLGLWGRVVIMVEFDPSEYGSIELLTLSWSMFLPEVYDARSS